MVIMKNKNLLTAALIFLITVLIFSDVYAGISAKVDRNTIALDETVNLTIRKDGSSFFPNLDLSALEKDFRVAGQNQSSSTQIVNGNVNSSVTVNVVLAPRRIGDLRIPTISVGKEKTVSINVHVKKEAEAKTKAVDVPIFIETSVDTDSVFVQSQVIYTLKIYVAVGAKVHNPGAPEIQDALIETLDDISYDKIIDGKSYRVFELNYAIFPQKSGLIEIPQMVVQATITSQQRYNNFFDPFSRQEKVVRLRSESENILVKEKPSTYPDTAVWLPTNSLTVSGEWSRKPHELQVGESVTITINMIAEGLLGSQLPPIQMEEIGDIKLYQGNAEISNRMAGIGIVGVRQESIALIPTKAGAYHLPEITIPWWNKKTSRIEYALISQKELNVKGVPLPESSPQLGMAPVPESDAQQTANMMQTRSADIGSKSTVWIIVSCLFGLLWIVTLLVLFRTRHQLALTSNISHKESDAQRVRENDAFKMLRSVCQQNDPLATRKAAIIWAQTFWPEHAVYSLSDVKQLISDSKVLSLLDELDMQLYSKEEKKDFWQGEELLKEFELIRKDMKNSTNSMGGLQPLYK